MEIDKSSRTALTAAAARAAHLIVDEEPVIFADTLAERMLGELAEEYLVYHRKHGGHLVLASARAQVVCRSRYTEERLAAACGRGVAQYVILGAGLDSYAYRQATTNGGVHVFEVDHPATQRTKRELLRAAGIPIPGSVTFVPTDLSESLDLGGTGFDPDAPALVSWLGVTVYLSREAIAETLAAVGRFAPGSELVADYALPAELRDEAATAYVDSVARASAEWGEPWLSFFTPEEMTDLLHQQGFTDVRHASRRASVPAEMWDRTDALRPTDLFRMVHARVP